MNLLCGFIITSFLTSYELAVLFGINVQLETVNRENDIILLPNFKEMTLMLFGNGINTCSEGFLTPNRPFNNDVCLENFTKATSVIKLQSILPYKSEFKINKINSKSTLYFCLFCDNNWYHQGTSELKSVVAYDSYVRHIWLIVIACIFFSFLSAFCSATNIGLLTLQPGTLKFFIEAGNEIEKKYSKRIYPIRKHGNILLCTILFTNVLANSTLTILLKFVIDNPIVVISIATVGIVIFGELIPQAFGARYGLVFSYYTIWITIICMCLTSILSYPLGKILDFVVGKEINQPYNKEQLKQIIKQQEKFGMVQKDEVEIISSALTLTDKTVADVMTPISHAYMISNNAVLDYNLMKEIVCNGYTRIPIYERDKNNIKGLLNIKDLLFIDPQDNTPVSTICTFYNHPILIVPDDVKLPEILNEFKQGKAHIAFIETVITTEDGDPYRQMIGLITLEDVIEEILQDEIVDETDIFYNNTLRERKKDWRSNNIGNFVSGTMSQNLSPYLYRATLEYMSKSISSFHETHVTQSVLTSLLKSKIVSNYIYNLENVKLNKLIEKGEFMTKAILILQGKVSVEISTDGLNLEGGPFILFGESILENINAYMEKVRGNNMILTDAKKMIERFKVRSNYSVTALSNLQYISISAPQYVLMRYLSDKNFAKKNRHLNSEIYAEEWENLSEVLPEISKKLKPKITK